MRFIYSTTKKQAAFSHPSWSADFIYKRKFDNIQNKVPLNLFVIFEKVDPIIYTSMCLSSNHFVIILDPSWYYSFVKCLRGELTVNYGTLLEQSCIDTQDYRDLNNDFFVQVVNRRLLFFSVFYHYHTKIRLTLLLGTNPYSELASIEQVYGGAS